MSTLVLIVLITLAIVVFILSLWLIPQWQLAPWRGKIKDEDWLKLKNETRATLAQVLGGTLVLSGVYFTYRNMTDTEKIAENNLEVSRTTLSISHKNQLAERFTKAIEQIGKSDSTGKGEKLQENSLGVRLGGIYALEHIYNASDENSKEYHLPIIQILTAYVRERAPWSEPRNAAKGRQITVPECSKDDPPTKTETAQSETTLLADVPIDVETILFFLANRKWIEEEGSSTGLDLRGTKFSGLRETILLGAKFNRVILSASELNRVKLSGAQIEDVGLSDSSLQGADLTQANLKNARITQTNLDHATLREANLDNAEFSSVNLKGALLSGASLREAQFYKTNLEGADLSGAHLDNSQFGEGVCLKKAILRDASLKGASLTGGCLRGARLDRADLSGAFLSGANLNESTLTGSILASADLSGASLLRARLQGVDLTQTKGLTWEQLSKASIDADTKLPPALEERRKAENSKPPAY